MSDEAPVWVVQGRDPTLRARALRDLVDRLVGDDDHSLAVTELTVPARGARAGAVDPEADDGGRSGDGVRAGDGGRPGDAGSVVATAVDACRTMPFGTTRRIVVLRDAGALVAGDVRPLAEWCAAPDPTAVLVLEAGEGTLPAVLSKAVKAAGGREVGPPEGKVADVLAALVREGPVRLERDAVALVADRLGEDLGRLPAVLEVLAAAYGPGARVGADDVEPYLGADGAVPTFALTNAIDDGDVAATLATLARLVGPTGMHPLQVLAVLHSHVRRLVRLDDPAVVDKASAVAALATLGGRPPHPYVAEKAWRQARALGTAGVVACIDLLATADRDLKGASRVDGQTVVEVLVTRLAGVARRARRSPRPGAGRRRA